jgi:hypothetical protein
LKLSQKLHLHRKDAKSAKKTFFDSIGCLCVLGVLGVFAVDCDFFGVHIAAPVFLDTNLG